MVTDRCYSAATLEFSQPENEERKVRALAAATTELEKLFKKQDFGRMKVVHFFFIYLYTHAFKHWLTAELCLPCQVCLAGNLFFPIDMENLMPCQKHSAGLLSLFWEIHMLFIKLAKYSSTGQTAKIYRQRPGVSLKKLVLGK